MNVGGFIDNFIVTNTSISLSGQIELRFGNIKNTTKPNQFEIHTYFWINCDHSPFVYRNRNMEWWHRLSYPLLLGAMDSSNRAGPKSSIVGLNVARNRLLPLFRFPKMPLSNTLYPCDILPPALNVYNSRIFNHRINISIKTNIHVKILIFSDYLLNNSVWIWNSLFPLFIDIPWNLSIFDIQAIPSIKNACKKANNSTYRNNDCCSRFNNS